MLKLFENKGYHSPQFHAAANTKRFSKCGPEMLAPAALQNELTSKFPGPPKLELPDLAKNRTKSKVPG